MKIAYLSLFLFCLFAESLRAQNVGIGTNTPDASAKLDITSTNSGMLIPRVSLLSVSNNVSPIASPLTSLLVYNTNTLMVGGQGAGYYFWNGAEWEKLFSGAFPTFWSLYGNALTTPGTDYLGTSDATDFVLSTNGTERMRISATGNIGVGTNLPSYLFHVENTTAIAEEHLIHVNYATASNGGSYNSGIYVDASGSGTSDVFGIHSNTSTTGNGNSSAIAGLLGSTGGTGYKIAVASQLFGSGNEGAGLSAYVSGSWYEAYGLIVDVAASGSNGTYGLYVKGTPDYSGFMESGNFYVNDNVAIGVNADPPQAKLHVDGNIKSEFLAGGAAKRMLYTDSDGQITALDNGFPGDVLVVNNSNIPEWAPNSGSTIHFKSLTSPFSYSGGAPDVVVDKSFTAFNDTVVVNFSMSASLTSSSLANNLPLFPYKLTLTVNSVEVYISYVYPNSNGDSGDDQGRLSSAFSIPVECIPSSANLIEVFIEELNFGGSLTVDVNPLNGENASLIIYDMPTNE